MNREDKLTTELTADSYWLRIIGDDTLQIMTSPGMYRWTRQNDGTYTYARGILGGSAQGQHTAAEVAQEFVRRYPDDYERPLIELGWLDVLDAAKVVVEQVRHEQIGKRVEELPGQIATLRSFLEEHQGWDYRRFRQAIYDEAVAAGMEEDEISVRRHHIAAINNVAMLEGGPKRLADMTAELDQLNKAHFRSPQEQR